MNPDSRTVFITTPAMGGKVNIQYSVSLCDTVRLLDFHGIQSRVHITDSGSLLAAERNRLTKEFLDTGFSHMLCIDADLGWPPQTVVTFLNYDLDFVAGVYPSRRETTFLFRPKKMDNGAIVRNKIGLLGMECVPAGFMLIKREAILKMQEHHKDLYFCPTGAPETEGNYCLFDTGVVNGEFWGEDYIFCNRAREAGIDIWTDMTIEFDHDGTVGRLMSVITNKKSESLEVSKSSS